MSAKTKIDWCDATWNPVTGCLHGCEYCYARRIAERFSYEGQTLDALAELQRVWLEDGGADLRQNGCHVLRYPVRLLDSDRICPYPFAFAPTLHRYKLDEPQHWKKPHSIFVCSMADLFGEWVPDEWILEVFRACQSAPQHRYVFLTKNPSRYDELLERYDIFREFWKKQYFGATATNNAQLTTAANSIATWLSIEPIHEPIYPDFLSEHWKCVVIGAETGNRKGKVNPEKEWIMDIVEACKFLKVLVFMKESLRDLMGDDFRQDALPWEVSV